MTAQPQALWPGRGPSFTPLVLSLIVATYLLALCNGTFWGHLLRIFEGRMGLGLIFTAAIWALILLVTSLFAARRAQKPVPDPELAGPSRKVQS